MLDLKFIREHPDAVRENLKNRNMKADIDGLLDLDRQRREFLSEVEEFKRQRNVESDKMAGLVRGKQDISGERQRLKELSQKIKSIDDKVDEIRATIDKIVINIPNITHDSVPIGKDASVNKMVKSWGNQPMFSFPVKDHLKICEDLDLVDLTRAGKISGSNFVLFKGKGARLERALINFMLGLHTKKNNYTEISPPLLVNRASMTGTGQLPRLEEDMYHTDADDFFLIPTAEVPVTNIFRDEVIDAGQLPIYYTAYTPCFRREAGSYGKDTKGLQRVHQFDKVELVKFVRPETSYDELEKLLLNAEEVLQLLKLPYRVMALSTGDISFAAAKCYDIEAWAPGMGKWLEVSSCSNFEDFQARRASIRFKDASTGKTGFVHTLNGSGVALARTFIALLENHQQADGSILIPEALRPYMDGLERITA